MYSLLVCLSIHPSIFYTAYPLEGGWDAAVTAQLSLGERQGTPWTGRQGVMSFRKKKVFSGHWKSFTKIKPPWLKNIQHKE